MHNVQINPGVNGASHTYECANTSKYYEFVDTWTGVIANYDSTNGYTEL